MLASLIAAYSVLLSLPHCLAGDPSCDASGNEALCAAAAQAGEDTVPQDINVEHSTARIFRDLAQLGAETPCAAGMTMRALLTNHGTGSAMNSFVKEVVLAIHDNKSLSICSPPGVVTLWASWYGNAGLATCGTCDYIKGYNNKLQGRQGRYYYEQHIHRGNIEDLLRPIYQTLFTPSKRLDALVKQTQDELGILTHRYVSVHMRRGDDKQLEAPPSSTLAYADAVRRLCKIDVGRCDGKVFLASDDSATVSVELQDMLGPAFKVVHQSRLFDKQKGPGSGVQANSRIVDFRDDEESRQHLVVDLELLRRAYAFVGTGSSNLGRFVYLTRMGDPNLSVSMDDGGYFLKQEIG